MSRDAMVACLALLSVGGCRADDARLSIVKPPALEAQVPRARVYARTRVDTVVTLGDAGIRAPEKMFVTKGGFVVQSGVTTLVEIGRDGRVLWQHDLGNDGVSRITDIQRGAGDTLFVLDSPAKRLWVVTGTGKLADSVSTVRVGATDTFVPLRGGRFLAVTADSVSALVEFDRSGGIVKRTAFPWKPFQETRALARQGYAGSAVDSTWAFATAFSDAFVVFNGSASRYVGRMVDPVPFPDVIVTTRGLSFSEKLGRVTETTESVAFDPQHLLILYAGADTTQNARLIDRYRLKDGGYSDSFRLPSKARWIAGDDQRVYVLTPRQILAVSVAK